MTDPKFIIWTPVRRSDISWNFEKFLIDQNGNPVKRYSRTYQTAHIAKDIEDLF
jgi:glutathione peroxidase